MSDGIGLCELDFVWGPILRRLEWVGLWTQITGPVTPAFLPLTATEATATKESSDFVSSQQQVQEGFELTSCDKDQNEDGSLKFVLKYYEALKQLLSFQRADING